MEHNASVVLPYSHSGPGSSGSVVYVRGLSGVWMPFGLHFGGTKVGTNIAYGLSSKTPALPPVVRQFIK